MNYSRIVGLISDYLRPVIFFSFESSSEHVKKDYFSATANMQYLKVMQAVEESRAQTTFSLKVALMSVKVTR